MTATTATATETIIVPNFARSARQRDRHRHRLSLDTATRLAIHFTAAARPARLDRDRTILQPCGGGYRVLRKRLSD